jgi:hypothetical protein
MNIINIEKLFVKIDDAISSLNDDELKLLLDLKRYKKQEMRMFPSEYITLLLLYRYGYTKSLKATWDLYKRLNKTDFPNMPSYNVFVTWINRLLKLLDYLIQKNIKCLSSELGIIDSTKLETTKPYRRGKVHPNATLGHSSLGEFRGFKLHVLINERGVVCQYAITPANVHDITPVKQGFLAGHTGTVLADSGYISKAVYYQLMASNIHFVAKPKANMMKNNSLGLGYLPDWESNFSKIYKKRMNVERLFDYFKDKLNMVLNKLHSTKALYVHVVSTILANQLMKFGEIEFTVI